MREVIFLIVGMTGVGRLDRSPKQMFAASALDAPEE